jgi:cell wall-associated NlpC family hydrolase
VATRSRRPLIAIAAAFTAVAAIGVGVSLLGGSEPAIEAAPSTTRPETPATTPPPASVTTVEPPTAGPAPAAPPEISPPPAAPTRAKAARPVATPAKAPKPAKAADEPLPFEGSGPLPVDSPLDLPPMLQVNVEAGPSATPEVTGLVLGSPAIALSPAVRRVVEGGGATTSTLELLRGLAKRTSPLLVHRVRGGTLRVQATSLAATRDLVTWLGANGRGDSVSLHPVPRDFADEAQSRSDRKVAGIGAEAARIAQTAIGIPYSWGGGTARGPSTGTCAGYRGSIRPCPATRTVGFDCSGLMLYAYAQVGITLDHYAAFQYLEGRRIPSQELAPGDMVFFHPKADGPGHVGMFIGDGKFVHAPRTGDVVKISVLADAAYAGSYMGAVRPY